jgi:hypothetical protein
MTTIRVRSHPFGEGGRKDGASTVIFVGTKPHAGSVAKGKTDCKNFREKLGDEFPNWEEIIFTTRSTSLRGRLGTEDTEKIGPSVLSPKAAKGRGTHIKQKHARFRTGT